MAVSKRWLLPEKEYREWYKTGEKFGLGKVQFVKVEEEIWVANMIGQHKINKDENGKSPIRYDTVTECLMQSGVFAKELEATVHMPRIGCGLAGGSWDMIMIFSITRYNTIYTLKRKAVFYEGNNSFIT